MREGSGCPTRPTSAARRQEGSGFSAVAEETSASSKLYPSGHPLQRKPVLLENLMR